MELEDVKIYHARLENELSSMLEQRKGIVRQIEIDQETVAELTEKRVRIGEEIAKSLNEERKETLKIQEEKRDFLKGLEIRESIIRETLVAIENKEVDIEAERKKLENGFIALEKERRFVMSSGQINNETANVLAEERRKIREDASLVNIDLHNADVILLTAEARLQIVTEQENALQKEKVKLSLEAEKNARDKEMLAKERDAIEKDRQHLFSQQQTLKLAFEEARKKNLL